MKRRREVLEIGKPPPPAFYLLREADRAGARLEISADGQLVLSDEALIPNSLREKIFAAEAECVQMLLQFQHLEQRFNDFVRIANQTDLASGLRFALVPTLDGKAELAVHATKAPLQPWVWVELQSMREGIIAGLRVLGLSGVSVDLSEILTAIRELWTRGVLH
jgi:hypothetical protein